MVGRKFMSVVKVTRNFQVSIPKEVREELGISEGDLMECEITDGSIVLKPKKLINRNQAWFFSKEWQEKEKEAEEAIRKGEIVGPFENIEDALEALKKTKV